MAKNPRKDRKPPYEPRYDIESIALTTEMTGLMPAPVLDETAAEAYTDLARIPKPQVDDGAKPKG